MTLDLRRLRLLHELHQRGTIAAVADALQLTPSAVSQQLSMLERETGVKLLERAGRGVRLTDPALVLVEHAEALLDRAAVAEADLAAATGAVAGRARIAAFQSAALWLVLPAMSALADDAPRLRCELVEAEPEDALPALARGDLDVVVGDEWQHQPWSLARGIERHDLLRDPVRVIVAAGHPGAATGTVALASLADAPWIGGHPRMGWEALIQRTCRRLGGFDPVIRHRVDDATVGVAVVARGLGVTLLPEFALRHAPPGVAVCRIAEGAVDRRIAAATRTADAARPSTRAVLAAIHAQAATVRA